MIAVGVASDRGHGHSVGRERMIMGRMYTWGSPEGVQAVINEMSSGFVTPYDMSLNADDMEGLVRALAHVADSDACEGENGNPDDHESGGGCLDTCWRMRASSLLGSIAESVNVEWV